ncbi:LCP family protein [Corynebacterium aquatimens]|uniref:LCP family protein n=1 Tax=Corynebacterium TaxID=1716 RepID=UPI001F28B860|nr:MULTISPECIES: LCP family protein [Corynebacterium]QYH19096.1 LCP family protein [Corynebacterium aquatimens]UIZ92048.1 LCP family protein [Corynebacterium sp. CNCTC7651]
MPTTPHSNDPRDNLGDYVLGKDGKPIVDRYGRPVRRRPASGGPAGDATRRVERPERVERPRQEYQPRRAPEYTRVERADYPERPRQERPRQQYEPRRVPEYTRQERPQQRPPQQVPPQRTQQRPPQQVPQQPRRARRQVQQPEQPVISRQTRAGSEPRVERRRRKAKAPGCSTILAILLVLAIAGTLLADARMDRVQALPEERIANTAGTNWLLVGSDSRVGLSEEEIERLGTGGDIGSTRTDTIMLLHLPLTGKATLISIPRDSYVAVPGYGYDKVNAAYAYGGPQLLAATVEQATGLRVDRYAEIGMGGLARVTDAVGGVEICVAEPIDDPLANLNVQPGCQKMDGATGLGYVRTRATAQGDLDRVARQREFLGALVARTLSPAVLLNPFRLIPLAWTVPTLFVVGQGDHVWNLARIPLAMRGGLETVTIPIGDFMDTEVGNVVIWDEYAAEELFSSLR